MLVIAEKTETTSLSAVIDEVLTLRAQVSMPSESAIPQTVLDSLIAARAKADRIEALSIDVLRLRYHGLRVMASAKASADDAWAEGISELNKQGVRNHDQYEGPRERYAEVDLATMEFRRTLRKAEKFLSLVDEASDVIKIALRGVNETIQDHRTWLRTIQVQSYIEK
jgi:hypothetical protein